MSERQIKYGDSSYTLRHEYPDSWGPAGVAAVKLEIRDEAGGEVLAATSATVTSATTLASSALAGDRTIVLTADRSLVPGDRLWIAASSTGPGEIVEVYSYASATKAATLVDDLTSAHYSGAAVSALWCTYAADLSAQAAGTRLVLEWQPQSSDEIPVTEIAVIARAVAAPSRLWRNIDARWPAVGALVDAARRTQLDDLLALDYSVTLRSYGLQAERIVDSPLYESGLELYSRLQILGGVGDAYEYEYTTAHAEWSAWVDRVANLQLWQDIDQDQADTDYTWQVSPVTERSM